MWPAEKKWLLTFGGFHVNVRGPSEIYMNFQRKRTRNGMPERSELCELAEHTQTQMRKYRDAIVGWRFPSWVGPLKDPITCLKRLPPFTQQASPSTLPGHRYPWQPSQSTESISHFTFHFSCYVCLAAAAQEATHTKRKPRNLLTRIMMTDNDINFKWRPFTSLSQALEHFRIRLHLNLKS